MQRGRRPPGRGLDLVGAAAAGGPQLPEHVLGDVRRGAGARRRRARAGAGAQRRCGALRAGGVPALQADLPDRRRRRSCCAPAASTCRARRPPACWSATATRRRACRWRRTSWRRSASTATGRAARWTRCRPERLGAGRSVGRRGLVHTRPMPSRLDLSAAIVDLDGTLVDTLGDFTCGAGRGARGTAAAAASTAAEVETMVGKGSEHLIRSALRGRRRRRGPLPGGVGRLPAALRPHQRPVRRVYAGVERACACCARAACGWRA